MESTVLIYMCVCVKIITKDKEIDKTANTKKNGADIQNMQVKCTSELEIVFKKCKWPKNKPENLFNILKPLGKVN